MTSVSTYQTMGIKAKEVDISVNGSDNGDKKKHQRERG